VHVTFAFTFTLVGVQLNEASSGATTVTLADPVVQRVPLHTRKSTRFAPGVGKLVVNVACAPLLGTPCDDHAYEVAVPETVARHVIEAATETEAGVQVTDWIVGATGVGAAVGVRGGCVAVGGAVGDGVGGSGVGVAVAGASVGSGVGVAVAVASAVGVAVGLGVGVGVDLEEPEEYEMFASRVPVPQIISIVTVPSSA